ncbi:MAG: hypothetical protein ACJ8EL_13250, partial [Rhizomicrobium sp.]
QYTVWGTDSSGNVVSNLTGGVVVSGTSNALEALEPSFHQDLNGDSEMGIVAHSLLSTVMNRTQNDPFVFHPVDLNAFPLAAMNDPSAAYPNESDSGNASFQRVTGSQELIPHSEDHYSSALSNAHLLLHTFMIH